jgi:hypothetical protein
MVKRSSIRLGSLKIFPLVIMSIRLGSLKIFPLVIMRGFQSE